MEQSAWEADRSAVSQQISYILWNRKFHYHIHKSVPPIPVMSQINPVPVTPLKVHFNLIFPHMPGFQDVSFPQVSPWKLCIHLTMERTTNLKLDTGFYCLMLQTLKFVIIK